MEELTKYNEQYGSVTIKPRFKIGDKAYFFISYQGELEIKEGQVDDVEISYKVELKNGNLIENLISIRYGFDYMHVMDEFCFTSKREAAEALKAIAEEYEQQTANQDR